MREQGKACILVSPIAGQAAPSIIQYFKQRGFRVIGIDTNELSVGTRFVDLFYSVPRVGDKVYQSRIYEIIENDNVDMFISWLDQELIFWNIKYYAGEIPKHMYRKFMVNFRKDFLDFCDKFRFYQKLINFDFLVPRTFLLSQISLEGNSLEYPLILKPRLSSGSKDTFKLNDKDDLEYYTQVLEKKGVNLSDFVVQPFLSGNEYTIDFFAINGDVLNSVIRLRVAHRGVSIIGKVVDSDSIECLLRKFVKCFNIEGLHNIQVIESHGDIFLLEWNQRPSGSIMLSVKSGVDLLQNFIEYKRNQRITLYGKPRQTWMFRYYCEYYYDEN